MFSFYGALGLALIGGGIALGQCSVTLNPSSVHVTAASATGTFAISASTSNCSRTAKSNASWIAVAFGQTGNGSSGSVGYTIDASTLYTPRTGTITIGTASSTAIFTVTQDAFKCAYSFSPLNQTVQPPGGNFTLGVGTTCTWTASTTTPWITLNAGGATGNGSLSYTVAPNNAIATRSGSITINDQTYTVTQFGTGCNYTVSPAAANFNATGGMGQLTVQADNSCSWSAQSSVDWIGNLNIAGAPVTTPSGNATITYTVAANTGSQSRTAALTIAGQQVTVSQAGVGILLSAQSVVNGASFLSGQIAPGELITIFGSALGPPNPVGLQLTPDGSSVTTALGGTQVLFDGAAAPLTYVSDGQVNAIVPFALGGSVSTQVQVQVNGTPSGAVTLFLTSSSPAIFTTGGGSGQAAALNQDNSPNSSSNPASVGSVLQVYMTGAGQTNPAATDGTLAGTTPWIPLGAVTATVGGVPAVVQYAGSAYGLVAGVTQVNVVVPAGAPTGSAVPLVLQVGPNPSPAGVTVAIQ
ncbi:MAG TPA: BACON domain-containing carbohydrate-binding protein [Bryobacteraceae bacterium]|jgi:uncharacterized protein (TIGR03437 family)